MNIEVINTGTEILLGHVTNTHLGYLAKELFSIGHRIDRQTTVPDGDAIRTALQEALVRNDLILVTGGLGPTSDDITREIVAELTQAPLQFHQEIWDHIVLRFQRRGKVAGENTRKQAYVPEGAVFFQNQNGTAPGLALHHQQKLIVLLPGPPRELIGMWENQVFPWLKKHFFEQSLSSKNNGGSSVLENQMLKKPSNLCFVNGASLRLVTVPEQAKWISASSRQIKPFSPTVII